MEDQSKLLMETVLLFIIVLLLAFSCGFFRILKQYFSRRTRRPPPIPRNVLIAQIRSRDVQTTQTCRIVNESNVTNSIYPGEEQISPPPYAVVENILPPSYDEAVKKLEEGEREIEGPKSQERF